MGANSRLGAYSNKYGSLVVPTSVSFVIFCNFQLTTNYNPGFGTAGEIHANALAPMLCFVLRKFHVKEGQNVRD